jgi:CTP synthase
VAGSLAEKLYGASVVYERHRHRFELNNHYREQLAKLGLVCSGLSPDYRLVEIIEIPAHPYFIATQFHPEFRSRPNRAHPLFEGLIAAAVKHSKRLYGAPVGEEPLQAVVVTPEEKNGDAGKSYRRGGRGELNVAAVELEI